jgi:hypothetical protein
MLGRMDTVDWLLEGDPAIRWQALRDLVDPPPATVALATERARVAREGWGARLLDLQGPDGNWAGGALFPTLGGVSLPWTPEDGQPWTGTAYTLVSLMNFGVDQGDPRVRRAVDAVRDHVRWEHDSQPFFEGEVEPCINGMTVSLGVYFGVDVAPIVDRLLGEALEDGGWNCEAENGSVRSSVHTTISVLEGLLAFEQAHGAMAEATAIRRRGEAYLLERGLMRRRSTGEVIDPVILELAFPTRWRFDILRGLAYFRATGDAPDPRLGEAVDLLCQKRQADGRWLLERTHKGATPFEMERTGEPSRWTTLRALRVLRWADAAGR